MSRREVWQNLRTPVIVVSLFGQLSKGLDCTTFTGRAKHCLSFSILGRKLTTLEYAVEIVNGTLVAPRDRMKREFSELEDCPNAVLILKQDSLDKTHRQLRTFHGTMIEQIQAFIMATEGLYKSADRIKQELKDQFLTKVKRYWDDGSPVILKIAHPTKPGVSMDWHMEETPSLSTLSIDQMRAFIDAILDYYLHTAGLHIEIDPDLASHRYTDEKR